MECSSNQKRVCWPTAVEGLIWYTSVKLLEYNIIRGVTIHSGYLPTACFLLQTCLCSLGSRTESATELPHPLEQRYPNQELNTIKRSILQTEIFPTGYIGLYFMLNSSNYIDKKNLQVDSPVGAEAKSMVLRLPGKMSMCPTIIKLRANVLTNRPYRRLFLTQRSIVGSGEHSWIVLLIRRRRYSSRDGAPRAPLFACPSVCFMSPAKN